jgi:hypothetical protein
MYTLLVLVEMLVSCIFAQTYLPPNLDPQNDGDITTAGACPADLPASPGYEFPHLAIPVSQNNPDTAYPNTFSPYITALDFSMIMNFDVSAIRLLKTTIFKQHKINS